MHRIALAALMVTLIAAPASLRAEFVLLDAPPALPEGVDAESFVDQRTDFFRPMGAAMRTLGAFARGRGGTLEEAGEAAAKVQEHAHILLQQFPPGTGIGVSDSEAKLEIWSDWDGFVTVAASFSERADALVAAIESGDTAVIGAAVGALGGGCGDCHTPYRQD